MNSQLPRPLDEFSKQWRRQERYGIHRVRAGLIETLDIKWAEELRQPSGRVCQAPPFWFTASGIFARENVIQDGSQKLPLFLLQPEIVLENVWVSAVDTELWSLAS